MDAEARELLEGLTDRLEEIIRLLNAQTLLLLADGEPIDELHLFQPEGPAN